MMAPCVAERRIQWCGIQCAFSRRVVQNTRFKRLFKKKVGRLRQIFVQSIFRASHKVEFGLSGVKRPPPPTPFPPFPLRNKKHPRKWSKYAHTSGEGEILLRNCCSVSNQNVGYQARPPIPRGATTQPSFPRGSVTNGHNMHEPRIEVRFFKKTNVGKTQKW